jgi:hypothetical protein
MKNFTKSIAIAAITALSFTSMAFNGNENDANSTKKSNSFAVGMYQSVNTMKMNVLIKKDGGQRIHIILKNLNGDILYSEYLSKKESIYARKFDFNEIENGQYSFEISNGKTTEVKTVKIDRKKIEAERIISLN